MPGKSFVIRAMNLGERCLAEAKALDENRFFLAKLTATEELQQLPEYQTCLQSILADETLSSQLKVLAGASRRSKIPECRRTRSNGTVNRSRIPSRTVHVR